MRDSARQLIDHVRRSRAAQIALAIALLLNVAAVSIWFWSRDGQTTLVRIEARGQEFSVYVDGHLQAQAVLADVPASGGLALTLDDTHGVPSMATPRGIDSVRVTNLDTGDVVFEDDFSSPPGEAWSFVEGQFTPAGGALGVRGGGEMGLLGKQWGDVAVDVVYRNVRTASINLRTQDSRQDGLSVTVRPAWWNQGPSRTISIARGGLRTETFGRQLELSRAETLKAAAWPIVRPYPYMAVLLLVALVAVAALAMAPSLVRDGADAIAGVPAWGYIGGAAAVSFLITLYFNLAYIDHFPYVPDAIAYVFQAKIFAQAGITVAPPPVKTAFDFFDPPPMVLTDDKWASQYPFGHPLLLAPFQAAGVIWLAPALVAAGSVAAVSFIGRRVYDSTTGVLAAVLLLTSPFFVLQASNFMSHHTAAMYMLASLAAIVSIERRPLLLGALGGLAFGLFVNTRPLTAAALVPAFGLLLLAPLLKPHLRRGAAMGLGAFCVTGAVMGGAYLLYNHALTGDYFTTGYQQTNVSFFETNPLPGSTNIGGSEGVSGALGAGGAHNFSVGLQNERVQAILLVLVLHGWPTYIGLGFVLLPFLLGTRRLFDWWLLGAALSVMAIWVLYEGDGVMFGPRYWYEAIPFLMLLAARGAVRAGELLASAVRGVREGAWDGAGPAVYAIGGRAVMCVVVAALVGSSVWGWMLGNHPTWRADFVPESGTAMNGYFGMDDRVARLVDDQDLHNALVLVEDCPNFICYGSVFWRNDPNLDGDIVYARDVPALRDQIIAAYPGRAVYQALYNSPQLRPYRPGSPLPGRPTPAVPTATETAAAALTESTP
jgi:hypothetical protein